MYWSCFSIRPVPRPAPWYPVICETVAIFTVSPGLNEVRGAHDDEQQSAWPDARREARAAGCPSREGARRNVRLDAPNKITQLSINKICIIAMLCVHYAAH